MATDSGKWSNGQIKSSYFVQLNDLKRGGFNGSTAWANWGLGSLPPRLAVLARVSFARLAGLDSKRSE